MHTDQKTRNFLIREISVDSVASFLRNSSVEDYFNYFTEIEEHFQRRRGTILLLSTLDWALIETWKETGIPLEAVRRGIDASFERWERRPSQTRKVNSLAYCAQEVLAAAEQMREAAMGAAPAEKAQPGFETSAVADYLTRNAAQLEKTGVPQGVRSVAAQTAGSLRNLAAEVAKSGTALKLEDLERRLTVLEEKLLAALLASAPEEEIVAARSQAERELAPYRRKMTAPQIEQLLRQYVNKRLLDKYGLPRLSLFYMTD